jgi:O-antigen ligase
MIARPLDALSGGRFALLEATLIRRPALRIACWAACVVAVCVPYFVPGTTLVVLTFTVAAALWFYSGRDEQTALSVLFAATFLVPSSLIIAPLGEIGVPGLLFAGVLLMLWIYTRFGTSPGTDLGRQPLRYVVLAFAAVVLASYIAGQVRGLSPLEASGTDASLFGQACAIGVVLFVADTMRGVKGVTRVLQLIVGGCVVLALTAIVQFVGWADLYQTMRLPGLTFHFTEDLDALGRSGFHRVQGLAGHPIEYAVVLGMALPIALHFALNAPRGRRALWWTALTIIAGSLPLAVSRSGVLTAGVAVTVYLVTVRLRVLVNLLPVALLGVVAMGAVIPGLLGSIRSLFVSSNLQADPSIAGRTDDYAAVFTVWHQHPLLGLGPGTYVPKLYRILDNEYLYTLATMGAIGVLAEVAIIVTGYSLARRVQRTVADPKIRSMAQAIAASIAGAAVAAFTFDAFGYKIMMIMTFTLIGCSGALWRIAVRDRGVPVRAGME